MFSPELNHLFVCWKLYRSLIDYWRRAHDEYTANPGKEYLKNSLSTATESEEKAAEYWRLFVEGVGRCGAAVWYKPQLGVMIG